jgi:purine nucleosidase
MNAAAQQPLLIDHDSGTPEDLLAVALVLTRPDADLRGVVTTAGAGPADRGAEVTRKLLDFLGRSQVPVAASAVRVAQPFPTPWRRNLTIAAALPILNQRPAGAVMSETGTALMARLLRSSRHPVTILVTGPLTTVAHLLQTEPALAKQIARVVWMGGALSVPGNVSPADEPGHDGSAEWNAYADPDAVAQLLASGVPMVLCPLDATNKAPVTAAVRESLARVRALPLADLAGQLLALTAGDESYFWDAMAAAFIGKPDLFSLRRWTVDVIRDGASKGRIVARPGGRPVDVMTPVDPAAFTAYVLHQFSLQPPGNRK